MGFAGNLSTLSLVEVLQTINRVRGTGVLRLATNETGRDVVFSEGEIIGVAFRPGEERQALLRRLILQGKIDAATAAAISSSGKDSEAVVEAMVQAGHVSTADVQEAIVRQSEDELYSLCTWEYADFVFHDATAEDPASTQQVEQFLARPLKLSLNSLLMEAARRIDEWGRLRELIPNVEGVPGVAVNMEAEIQTLGKDYPFTAVVPLIDAVRSLEDIIRDSVATRLEIYSVMVDLLKAELIVWLTRDDIIAHAEHLLANKEPIRAAQLYRRALAANPSDHDINERLAECLAQVGSAPEAAGCFSQLALGYIEEHNAEAALSAALRAVSLADDDPHQRLILVRCLLDQGEKEEAVAELRKVVRRYLVLGQLEDARGTCLKILDIDPANTDARREMARIFATAERDPNSEDVVVCVQCGHINHREAIACTACEAPLRLECTTCGRTVAVSDRICIFCGANPHAGSERRKRVRGSPATSRIINTKKVQEVVAAKGAQGWKLRLEAGIAKARELEEGGQIQAALNEWREVALLNQNNAELQAHIRTLEARLNDMFTEQTIDLGHRLRRSRHFWRALKAYRSALRAMPADDPRSPRLQEILASTNRLHRRITLIYASAFLVIGLVAWQVSRPYLLVHAFARELTQTDTQLVQAEHQGPPAVFAALPGLAAAFDQLDQAATQLGHSAMANNAREELVALRARQTLMLAQLSSNSLSAIQHAIASKDLVAASAELTAYRNAFPAAANAAPVQELEKRLDQARSADAGLSRALQDAPAKLSAAEAAEKDGHLGAALASYRELAGLHQGDSASAASAALQRLEPQYKAYQDGVAQALSRLPHDLAGAEAALDALGSAAHTWQDADFPGNRARIEHLLDEAHRAYVALGPDPDQAALQRFLTAHRNAPEAVQASTRLDHAEQVANLASQTVTAYHAALAAHDYAKAWKLGSDLLSEHNPAADIRLPLVVESIPAGAQVRLGDEVAGRTPCVLLLQSDDQREASVSLAGWAGVKGAAAALRKDWHWQVNLDRTAIWHLDLGKAISQCVVLSDGTLAVLAGQTLTRVEANGHQRWQANLSGGDDLPNLERYRLAHAPLLLPNGTLVLGLPSTGVAMVDATGALLAPIPTTAAVIGRPALYTNDILGGHLRLAFADDALHFGDLGSPPTTVPLSSAALSGPLVLTEDLDRLLVVATVQGRLLAYEESTHNLRWNVEVKASEIGQLVATGPDQAVVVLDGSRVACYHLGKDTASASWEQNLQEPTIGDPLVIGGIVYQAVGQRIARITLASGAVLPPLALPAPASTAVNARGDLMAIGCRSGAVIVFRAGAAAWSSLCPAIPTAVACTPDKIVVGLANGTVMGYNP